jgi:hypothetical protein
LDISGSFCGVKHSGISRSFGLEELDLSENIHINSLNHLTQLKTLTTKGLLCEVSQNSISRLFQLENRIINDNSMINCCSCN